MKTLFAIGALAISLSALFYVETQAQAQALQLAKPFTGKVNKAVASTLGKRLNTMGFAANDPIYTTTLSMAETVVQGSIAAGSVAATVAAIGSAPVWLSVALGIGAVYEVSQINFGSSDLVGDVSTGKVKIIPSGATVGYGPVETWAGGSGLPSLAEMPTDYSALIGSPVKYPSNMPICAVATASLGGTSWTMCAPDVATIRSYHDLFDQYSTRVYYGSVPEVTASVEVILISQTVDQKVTCVLSPINCPEGVTYNTTRNIKYRRYYLSGAPPSESSTVNTTLKIFNNPSYVDIDRLYTLNDAVTRVPDAELNQRADPELLAAIANRIWQQAAQQPGYEGAPFDVQNPVTAADILADVAAGLYPHPTNYDLLSLPSPNPETVVELDPDAAPVPETASDTVTVDLGPDPGVAAPGLEDAPTGSTIVAHVMGLLPGLSAFTIPQHVSECQMPSFDFYGNTMNMSSGCDLIETQRDLLSTLFSAIWGISALTFVLRA